MMLHVFALCLLACGLSLADDTTDRLARVEALLAEMLDRNAQLEERIVSLEQENVAIKRNNMALEQRVSDIEERGIIGEHGIKEMVGPNGKSSDTDDSPREHRITDGYTRINQGKERILKPKRSGSTRFVSEYQGSAVAFTAVVSPPHLTNLGSGQTVKYDTVITNVGGAYHNTTGIFTAPLSGVYVFNFAIMMDPGAEEYLQLVKNGDHIMWNYGGAPGAASTHVLSASRTATVELTTGDEVWIRTPSTIPHGNGIIHGYGFTTFSGWIISLFQ